MTPLLYYSMTSNLGNWTTESPKKVIRSKPMKHLNVQELSFLLKSWTQLFFFPAVVLCKNWIPWQLCSIRRVGRCFLALFYSPWRLTTIGLSSFFFAKWARKVAKNIARATYVYGETQKGSFCRVMIMRLCAHMADLTSWVIISLLSSYKEVMCV